MKVISTLTVEGKTPFHAAVVCLHTDGSREHEHHEECLTRLHFLRNALLSDLYWHSDFREALLFKKGDSYSQFPMDFGCEHGCAAIKHFLGSWLLHTTIHS